MAARVFKETRKLSLAYHTFELSDLRRIAQMLDEESRRAVPAFLKRHPIHLYIVGQLKEEVSEEKGKEKPSPERIQELERKIEEEEREAREFAEEHCRVEWTIQCSDGSSFETADPSTFTRDALPCREIESIGLRFQPTGLDRSVSMRLDVSGGFLGEYNQVEVSGADGMWVNGLVAKIANTVAATENNRRLLYRHRGWWLLCLLAMLVASTFALMHLIAGPALSLFHKDLAGSDLLLFKLVPAFFAGWILSYSLRDYIEWLFPPIELKLGRPTRIERHRRYLYLIGTLIALPILVNLLSSLVAR